VPVVTAIDSASANPFGPVQALALPLLTIIAWADRFFWRCRRHRITGAALTELSVKTPAATQGQSETIKAMSFLSCFKPAFIPAAENPTGAVTPPLNHFKLEYAGMFKNT